MDGWDEREPALNPVVRNEQCAARYTYLSLNLWLTWLHISIEAGIIRTYIFIILLHQENEKENERGGDPFPIEAAHLIFSNRRLPL